MNNSIATFFGNTTSLLQCGSPQRISIVIEAPGEMPPTEMQIISPDWQHNVHLLRPEIPDSPRPHTKKIHQFLRYLTNRTVNYALEGRYQASLQSKNLLLAILATRLPLTVV